MGPGVLNCEKGATRLYPLRDRGVLHVAGRDVIAQELADVIEIDAAPIRGINVI